MHIDFNERLRDKNARSAEYRDKNGTTTASPMSRPKLVRSISMAPGVSPACCLCELASCVSQDWASRVLRGVITARLLSVALAYFAVNLR